MWFNVRKVAMAALSEEIVRRHSLRHLAEVFGMPEASLSLGARFGQELKVDLASGFEPRKTMRSARCNEASVIRVILDIDVGLEIKADPETCAVQNKCKWNYKQRDAV